MQYPITSDEILAVLLDLRGKEAARIATSGVCGDIYVVALDEVIKIIKERPAEWAKVNRIEVIDHTKRLEHGGGRAYVFWKDGVLVEACLQDECRTLKIFISNRAHPDSPEGGDHAS